MSDRTDTRPPWEIDPGAEAGLSARLGENVRMLRARAHISQEELAFRADIHRTQISLIESGTRTPRIGTAIKLAAALEVELATLLHGITYEPVIFSATRRRFRISDRRASSSGPQRVRKGDRRTRRGSWADAARWEPIAGPARRLFEEAADDPPGLLSRL